MQPHPSIGITPFSQVITVHTRKKGHTTLGAGQHIWYCRMDTPHHAPMIELGDELELDTDDLILNPDRLFALEHKGKAILGTYITSGHQVGFQQEKGSFPLELAEVKILARVTQVTRSYP